MAGRPRKPKKLKVVEGNPGKRNLDEYDEPEATGDLGALPKQFSPWSAEAECWRNVEPFIRSCGGGACDREHLITFCELYGKYRRAMDAGDDNLILKYVRVWQKMAMDLGLSPKARTQMRTAPKQDKQSGIKKLMA